MSEYIPRPARLCIRLDGVAVMTLRLENSVARQLLRTINAARERWDLSDESTADVLIAALQHELEQED